MYSIWEKIDTIRQKPETIRLQYLYGCVTVTMVFVVGIWFLSLGESFRTVATVVRDEDIRNKALQILPPTDQVRPSLSTLLEQEGGGIETGQVDVGTTENLFQTEMQEREYRASTSEDTAEVGPR